MLARVAGIFAFYALSISFRLLCCDIVRAPEYLARLACARGIDEARLVAGR